MVKQQQNTSLELDAAIEQLQAVDRTKLVNFWIKQYKQTPPKGTKRGLLERAEAYRLQTIQLDKMMPSLRRKLISIATSSRERPTTTPRLNLNSGTKLVREWHGKTHNVIVTDSNFNWNGKTYRSLSAVAFAITGVKWSGPRFFGIGK